MSTVTDEAAPEAEDLITLDEVASAGRTALYRLYNAAGEVIYVGISDDPVGRMYGHAREQPWWDEVADKTAVWYQTRAAAEVAETIAIGLEQPKYNKAKRYKRLPEQAFPPDPRALRRRAARTVAKPASAAPTAAAPAAAPSPAPPMITEPERPQAPWLSAEAFDPLNSVRFDVGLPPEWPANLWCVDYYHYDNGGDYGYEDWMRVHGGGCWDEGDDGNPVPGPLDYLRTRAAQWRAGPDSQSWMAPGATHDELYVQAGRNGTWIARTDSPFPGDEEGPPDGATAEHQRRFLFALKRAGRCASFRLGTGAWADGIEYAEEARVVAGILLLGLVRNEYMARATSCLEARYRESSLRRSGGAWPCDLHDIRRPRRNGTLSPAPTQNCGCRWDCREHPECTAEGSAP